MWFSILKENTTSKFVHFYVLTEKFIDLKCLCVQVSICAFP